MINYLSPKLDVIFKMIFGNAHNADILGDFLMSVLDIPARDIEKIAVLNPFVELETPDDKKSILDLKVELRSGRMVNVEIQVRGNPDMIQRLHYYKAKMVTEQITSGDLYTKLVPTSCVAILDYKMYDDTHCHHAFRYYDEKRDVEFSAYEEIHILEIPKLDQDTSNPALSDWLRFLNAKKEDDFNMLANKSEPMKKAVGVLASLSADEKTRMIAEAREKELRDQLSRERGAKEEGRNEGRNEGRQEGRLEIIRNMLSTGYSIADIAKITNVDASEIEKLKQ